MSATTFIYCLCEPGTKTIRYFGKANRPKDRCTDHMREARQGRNVHVSCWIRKLLKAGQRPELHVLCEVLQGDFERFERAFITLGRECGLDLTNVTKGGENPPIMRGAANPNFGKKHSAGRLEKMRVAALGKKNSPETRAKISAKSLLQRHTPETLLKMSAAQLARRKREKQAKLNFPG